MDPGQRSWGQVGGAGGERGHTPPPSATRASWRCRPVVRGAVACARSRPPSSSRGGWSMIIIMDHGQPARVRPQPGAMAAQPASASEQPGGSGRLSVQGQGAEAAAEVLGALAMHTFANVHATCRMRRRRPSPLLPLALAGTPWRRSTCAATVTSPPPSWPRWVVGVGVGVGGRAGPFLVVMWGGGGKWSPAVAVACSACSGS